MKRIAPFFAAALALMMILAGQATANEDSPLIGNWMAVSHAGEPIPEGEFWVENHADGTGILHDGGEMFHYNWFHDQEAGTCTVLVDDEEMIYNVTFEDDRCSFTSVDDPEDVMVMRRMEY